MLAERLRAALAAVPAAAALEADDYDWPGEFVAAAVLIAVTDRPDPGVILTLRQANLRRHPGQIAFPGGRIDPEDDGPVAAALREAEEEIGLDPACVAVAGMLGGYRAGSGYAITPVVGVVPPDLPLVPHEAEVAAVFEVPLAFLLDPANHVERTADFGGRSRRFHEIVWADRRIWGITAALIVNFAARVGTAP